MKHAPRALAGMPGTKDSPSALISDPTFDDCTRLSRNTTSRLERFPVSGLPEAAKIAIARQHPLLWRCPEWCAESVNLRV
jgi:hypothetical protein